MQTKQPDTDASQPADLVPAAQAQKTKLREAREYLGMGLGVGAFGVVSAAALGVTCPLCVVAAPALVGYGAFKHWQARRDGK